MLAVDAILKHHSENRKQKTEIPFRFSQTNQEYGLK